ncbi:hypothetical protein MNBD_GAMMA12-2668 [hydrothermal vent metagenome]|uniref:Uncharacterized protein n=1 Tax=hydrothermal vent metagenome TaxID=652676 RepID=A0A3B0Y8R4_9ZZZZ
MKFDFNNISKLKLNELNAPDKGCVVFFCRILCQDEVKIRRTSIDLLEYFFDLEFEKRTLDNQWCELSESKAVELIEHILEKRICYSTPSVVFDKISKDIATWFISMFSTQKKFFTNHEYSDDFSSAICCDHIWGVLENGIIVFDEMRIGILWVNDYD